MVWKNVKNPELLWQYKKKKKRFRIYKEETEYDPLRPGWVNIFK